MAARNPYFNFKIDLNGNIVKPPRAKKKPVDEVKCNDESENTTKYAVYKLKNLKDYDLEKGGLE